MTRRLAILVGVLTLVTVSVLWSRARTADVTATATVEAASEPERSVDLLLPAPASSPLAESPRDPEASTRAPQPEDEQRSEDGSSATLLVFAIDEASTAPMAGVRIVLGERNGGAARWAKHAPGSSGTLDESPITGADGRAEFELPPGVELELLAVGEGEVEGRVRYWIEALHRGERRELTLELVTGNDLHYFGRVLAFEGGRPIAGARVELHGARSSTVSEYGKPHARREREETLLAEHRTDADGVFELWLPSWMDTELLIQAKGFAPVLINPVRTHETPEKARVVLLDRSASLRARLLDASGGAVAQGAVRLWTDGYGLADLRSDVGELEADYYFPPVLRSVDWQASADSSGLCVLQDIPPEADLRVEILQPGLPSKTDLPKLEFTPGEVREVEWRIGAGCLVEGSVVESSGRPVAGVEIWLQRTLSDSPTFFDMGEEVALATTTDAGGRFSLQDVSAGPWWIGPAAVRNDRDELAIAPHAQVIIVEKDAARQEVLVYVQRGLFLRGHVLDPEGKPAPAEVLARMDSGALLRAQAGVDGAFSLGPLVHGRYHVHACARGERYSKWLEASGGDEDVVLRLQPGGSLSGVVLDGVTGAPVAVRVVIAMSGARRWNRVESAADGKFRCEGLEPRTYDVYASLREKKFGLLKGITVSAGSETGDLRLTLEPAALLLLRSEGQQRSVSSIHGSVTLMGGYEIRAGERVKVVVPPGHVVIESTSEGRTATKELDVVAGEEREIVLGDDE